MRILNREEVRQALPMREAIPIVKDAFAQLSAGQANVPLRTAIRPARHDGVALIMPGYLSGSDALAVKVVSVFPGNRAMRQPTIHALLLLLNAATGEVLAAMEGGGLTALRTGAASGVATDLLAREDAKIAAISASSRRSAGAYATAGGLCRARNPPRLDLCAQSGTCAGLHCGTETTVGRDRVAGGTFARAGGAGRGCYLRRHDLAFACF